MADDDLKVRASLEDDLTGPLRGVERQVDDTGDAVRRLDRRAASTSGTLGKLARTGGRVAAVAGRTLFSAARLGATGLAALSAAAVVGGAKMVSLASDAAETASKFATVFRGNSAEVTRWVRETNAAYGITTKELQDVTSRFGVFGKAAGIAPAKLQGFSTSLAQAGLDLSSFYNVDPEEAFTALSSGLAGEAEPLRRFGIFLSDATMKAEAATMGLTGELTEAQKVAIRQRLILKNLGDANGDLERTSGSLANKWRALKGRGTELATQIGTALMPVAEDLVRALDDRLGPIVARLTDQVPALTDAIDAGRWSEVALRVDAVAGAGGRLYGIFDGIRRIFEGGQAFGAIGAAFQADEVLGTGDLIEGAVTKIIDVGRDLVTLWRDGVAPAIESLGPVAAGILSPLTLVDDVLAFSADHARELRPLIAALVAGYAGLKAARIARDGITSATNAVNGARSAFATFRSGLTRGAGALRRFSGAGGRLDGLRLRLMYVADKGKAAGRALANGARSGARFARAGARSAAAWGRAKLASVASSAKAAAKALANGARAAGRWAASGARAALSWARATAATVAHKAATLAASAAQKVATAVQWALNAAMSANPVVLIVLAILALGAVLVLAYNKVGWFRDAVDAAFRFIGRVIGFVVDWVKDNWELMLAGMLGPLGVAIALIVHHWDKVKAAIGWVVDKVVDLWNKTEPARALLVELGSIGLTALKDAVGWVILKVVDLWNKTEPARSLLADLGDIGLTVLKDAVGWVVDKLQWLIDNGSKIAGFVGDVASVAGSIIPGDTPRPRAVASAHRAGRGSYHARGGARANLARSMAVHRAIDGRVPGRRVVTSSLRSWALGSPGSDHGTGRAYDLKGSNLNHYAREVRAAGGFAEHHGSGAGRHLHVAVGDTPRPRARVSAGASSDGGTLIVVEPGAIVVNNPASSIDLENAIAAGIARYDRDRRERGARRP